MRHNTPSIIRIISNIVLLHLKDVLYIRWQFKQINRILQKTISNVGKEYNQFYHDFSILREENEAVKIYRIALSANVAKVVRLGMGLLGIEVPARM